MKLISNAEVQEALAYVSEICPASVLVGGVALAFYGSERLTADIDVLVYEIPPKLKGKKLSFGGKSIVSPGGVSIDLIHRQDDWRSLYVESLAEGTMNHPIAMPGSTKLARLEHLVAMKMVASRPKDEIDLLFLLTHPKLEMTKLKKVLKHHLGPYAVQEAEQLALEAKWRKKQGML